MAAAVIGTDVVVASTDAAFAAYGFAIGFVITLVTGVVVVAAISALSTGCTCCCRFRFCCCSYSWEHFWSCYVCCNICSCRLGPRMYPGGALLVAFLL